MSIRSSVSLSWIMPPPPPTDDVTGDILRHLRSVIKRALLRDLFLPTSPIEPIYPSPGRGGTQITNGPKFMQMQTCSLWAIRFCCWQAVGESRKASSQPQQHQHHRRDVRCIGLSRGMRQEHTFWLPWCESLGRKAGHNWYPAYVPTIYYNDITNFTLFVREKSSFSNAVLLLMLMTMNVTTAGCRRLVVDLPSFRAVCQSYLRHSTAEKICSHRFRCQIPTVVPPSKCC